MRPIINIDKGYRAIVNQLIAAGESFEIKESKAKCKKAKLKKTIKAGGGESNGRE